ncbi:MAG: alpha/beta fold hydrolase [Planctomycetes bacterium]|nr:alpha/beta fold hydrolase [Planctomycetota bacterium]
MPRESPVREELFSYTSTLDGTGPLWAFAARPEGGRHRPLVIVMHGYSGSHRNVVNDCRRMAAKGMVAIAPDMRGAGDSAGKADSGGIEIMDIYDCVEAARRRYEAVIDTRNVNIWGYSGGGGNAVAAAVRFPDLFSTATSFFPMTDFAFWYRDNDEYRQKIDQRVGGSPEEFPGRYIARNYNLAAANNHKTLVNIFWDSEEVTCSPDMPREFVLRANAAGCTNVHANESRPGAPLRWCHGYTSPDNDLTAPEDDIFPIILKGGRDVTLPPEGRLVAAGFLVTREFGVFVGGGAQGAVTVDYSLDDERRLVIEAVEGSPAADVEVELRLPAGHEWSVEATGKAPVKKAACLWKGYHISVPCTITATPLPKD